jgi:hypothetical protein
MKMTPNLQRMRKLSRIPSFPKRNTRPISMLPTETTAVKNSNQPSRKLRVKERSQRRKKMLLERN